MTCSLSFLRSWRPRQYRLVTFFFFQSRLVLPPSVSPSWVGSASESGALPFLRLPGSCLLRLQASGQDSNLLPTYSLLWKSLSPSLVRIVVPVVKKNCQNTAKFYSSRTLLISLYFPLFLFSHFLFLGWGGFSVKMYNAKPYNDQTHNDKTYNDKAYNDKMFNNKAYNDKRYNDKTYRDKMSTTKYYVTKRTETNHLVGQNV
jgi:hypothetical protein